MAEQLVLEAVRNEHTASKQGLLQRLFAVWFDAFVYNQIWEDPRVDIEALKIDGDSRILTISSGGCNAMNYLLEGPESVTAVDLNKHHIDLLELKAAAARHLPSHRAFFEFFGEGKGSDTGPNYLRYIARNLSREARDFWESNTAFGKFLYGDRIAFFAGAGLYDHSRNGYFLRFFHRFARLLGCDPEAILKAKGLEERERIYEEKIKPFFDSRLIKTIGKLPITLFGLGIPPQQYDELKRDLEEGRTVIDIYEERTRRLACGFPIDDNYFAWQAFGRRYDTVNRKALPEYLKEENYEVLRGHIDRLETRVASATDVIRESPFGAFNRFVFLDAQDWMNADTMTELWTMIAERAESGSRIIFRTAGAASPLDDALPPELLGRFTYKQDLSSELFKKDRASIYGGFHLYTLR
ncbi:MAG: BtaA family protein [Acidobacteria bacterium]|nr:BtaA family protein [Acidobacteriota bacterium]